ncbi:MAG: thioredoxin family protein [Actinomycetes bacterium]
MLLRLIVIGALLVIVALGYWWWSARDGRVKRVEAPGALTPDVLGAPRGQWATFVQFSTPMCAKCPGTRALLLQVAQEQQHVAHVEIDASERLELARELGIMRTPTVLVLDSDGVVVARMDGAPTLAQVREALAAVPPPQDWTI